MAAIGLREGTARTSLDIDVLLSELTPQEN
jgi:hypothetical protein